MRQLDDALATAFRGIGVRHIRQRTVGIEAGRIMAERDRQRGDAALVVDQAVELCPLGARFLDAVADDDESARQDLDVVARAAEFFCAALHIGEEAPAGCKVGRRREDHLGGFGGQLAPGLGRASLNNDRPALNGPGDVERSAHRQMLSRVRQHMQLRGVEIESAFGVADEGIVRKTVPQTGHDIVEFARPVVAFVVLEMPVEAEIQGCVGVRRRHDVPAGAPTADVIQRSETTRDMAGASKVVEAVATRPM
ncbi:hypothetical protein ABID26_000889 [Mesorhizobium shonense]|uniref:Uncharacterized protein n=1 Tax=Mesorhizobium shonense TaxID=1209948 RepID=A0ABV2HLQ9_9HYPH